MLNFLSFVAGVTGWSEVRGGSPFVLFNLGSVGFFLPRLCTCFDDFGRENIVCAAGTGKDGSLMSLTSEIISGDQTTA